MSGGTFLDPVAATRDFATRCLGMVDPLVFDFAEGGPGDSEVGISFRYSEGPTPVANP